MTVIEMTETDSGIPRWVCTGCGKAVSGSILVDTCSDCGGEWVEATPERLACDACGAEDAARVLNSEHNRLCENCIRLENSIPADALDELREEWEEAARGSTSGRALGLETAADELRVLVEEHKGIPEEDDGLRVDGGSEQTEMNRASHLSVADSDCPDCGVTGQPAMDHTENNHCVNPDCRVVHYRPAVDGSGGDSGAE